MATKIKLSDLSNYLLKTTGAETDDLFSDSESHSQIVEYTIKFLLDFDLLNLDKIEIDGQKNEVV